MGDATDHLTERGPMITPDYSQLEGAAVTNQDDEKLGKVSGLFVDDELNVPTWIAVKSGLFGTHTSLIPLAESRFVDSQLLVPYSKDDLVAAPHHDPDVPLSVDEERLLFEHYNVGYGTEGTTGPHTGVDSHQTGLAGSAAAGSHPVVSLDEVTPPADGTGVPGLPLPEPALPSRGFAVTLPTAN
jgi:hypothetical protein